MRRSIISRRWPCAIGLAAAVLLAACTASNLFSYNDSLIQLYEAKRTADPDLEWVKYENAISGLERLSVEAAAEAAKTKAVENQIALYRVAATAAWQSESTTTGELVRPGVALCEQEKNRALVPRDCGMLLVIPILAAIDANTRAFNSKQREVQAADAGSRIQHVEAVTSIFTDFLNAASLLVDASTITQRYRASPGFEKALKDNMDAAFKLIDQAYQLLRLTKRVASDADAACAMAALKKKAVTAQVDSSITARLGDIPCARGAAP